MRVLLIHNKYGKPSGEEFMVESVGRSLRNEGHEVQTYYQDSASIEGGIKKLKAIATSFYSSQTLHRIDKLIDEYLPDIVQIQNVYPLISPHVFERVARKGIPIVYRCANYRLFCPTGLMLRNGKVCEICATRSHLNCSFRNCESNRIKSLVYGARNEYARMRDLIIPNVSAFMVPSKFQKKKFVSWGLEDRKIHVIPNLLPEKFASQVPYSSGGEYVAYVGRISKEKGIDLLLDAARELPEVLFKLAGHGQDDYLAGLSFPGNVEYCGMLEGDALHRFYADAKFVVIPSQWYETFGLVAIEALRHHKPVVASRIGALPETLIEGETGLLFDHEDKAALVNCIQTLANDSERLSNMQALCASNLDERFGEAVFAKRLLGLYRSLLNE